MTDSANKPKVDLGLLEEDDEFEEFPAEGEISSFIMYIPQSNPVVTRSLRRIISLSFKFILDI